MWLRIPTSHCSPATEDSTSPSDALCQRLAVSATWRGKLLRPQSWRLAWKTEGWRTRLSGLTLSPSQADCFVAAWLDSLAGSPARTSALQGDKPESRESEADCFLRSSDSFASWSPSSGSFLRTSRQFSIFQQEQPFLENLPRSGSMRNGELYERPMLVDRTGESGRLCWLTARAEDSESCGNHPGAVDLLTEGQTMHRPTPRTITGGAESAERKQELGRTESGGSGLQSAAANWPTPTTRDWKSGEASEETMNRNARPLSEIASHFSLPAPPTSTHGGKSPSGSTRRLNPDFVDWLMGLIPGWTDYAPLETASYLSRVRSLLRSYSGGRGSRVSL